MACCSVQLEGGSARVQLEQVAATNPAMTVALQRSVTDALGEAGFPTKSEGKVGADKIQG